MQYTHDIVGEHMHTIHMYTSRTCSESGTIRPKDRSETFMCVNATCGLVCNRDLNAAKNIMIRYSTLQI